MLIVSPSLHPPKSTNLCFWQMSTPEHQHDPDKDCDYFRHPRAPLQFLLSPPPPRCPTWVSSPTDEFGRLLDTIHRVSQSSEALKATKPFRVSLDPASSRAASLFTLLNSSHTHLLSVSRGGDAFLSLPATLGSLCHHICPRPPPTHSLGLPVKLLSASAPAKIGCLFLVLS